MALDFLWGENIMDTWDIQKAAEVIKNGGLVLFPTETVYGIGADGLNERAVKKIFEAKGRAQDNPLILHVASIDMVEEIAKEVISGKWGNGAERREKLTAAGYDYSVIQKKVNEILK